MFCFNRWFLSLLILSSQGEKISGAAYSKHSLSWHFDWVYSVPEQKSAWVNWWLIFLASLHILIYVCGLLRSPEKGLDILFHPVHPPVTTRSTAVLWAKKGQDKSLWSHPLEQWPSKLRFPCVPCCVCCLYLWSWNNGCGSPHYL